MDFQMESTRQILIAAGTSISEIAVERRRTDEPSGEEICDGLF